MEEVVELEFLFRVRLNRRRRQQHAPAVDPPERESTLDALVERGEDRHPPELHPDARTPQWEDRRQAGF
ncbi:hypothetical protein [Specibacter sp. NPDC078692]|uniref:hypothetical protein n=1 Tax=Specibacter sp. NPDC078692 TaxID=3155818 RepID=UPI00341B371B